MMEFLIFVAVAFRLAHLPCSSIARPKRTRRERPSLSVLSCDDRGPVQGVALTSR